jgi:hypothetical protein
MSHLIPRSFSDGVNCGVDAIWLDIEGPTLHLDLMRRIVIEIDNLMHH